MVENLKFLVLGFFHINGECERRGSLNLDFGFFSILLSVVLSGNSFMEYLEETRHFAQHWVL